MYRTCALLAACLLVTACQKAAVVSDSAPATEAPQPAPKAAEAPAAPSTTVIYHRDQDHGPRIYLPPDSAPCVADEAANVTYLPKALWRFDGSNDAWQPIEFGSAEHWRVGCNAMVALADTIGLDLEPGTYAVAAEINGRLEVGVAQEGPLMCNDLKIGAAPAGKVTLCILSAESAEARHVPDPSRLTP